MTHLVAILQLDGTWHTRGVGGPWGLAWWKCSHSNPQVSQSVNQTYDSAMSSGGELGNSRGDSYLLEEGQS